jgi:hypothetical protein
MVKENEARGALPPRDFRRAAETMLAALKVSSGLRAQLPSPGTAACKPHYERHESTLEKGAGDLGAATVFLKLGKRGPT